MMLSLSIITIFHLYMWMNLLLLLLLAVAENSYAIDNLQINLILQISLLSYNILMNHEDFRFRIYCFFF
jgi:hypothetical protein